MPYNRHGALRKLHILGRERGLDHDDLHSLARSLLGVDGLSALTNSQLTWLIAHLATDAKAGPSPVRNAITPRQIWRIHQYEAALGWADNPDRLAGFIARQCRGRRTLDGLTVWDASRLLTGLKKLQEHAA